MAKSSVNTPSATPSAPATVETLTARGRKTRDALLDAAQKVFETVGFPDTRVEQIAQEANVAYGTFYRYFESKEEVFRELSTRLFEDVHRREPADADLSPSEKLVASNRSYYQAYRRNARMMAIVEQVSTFNDEFRELRHEHRRQLIDRTSRAIARWQQDGLATATLDPVLAARAMAAMVDHTLYLWLIQGDEADEEALLDTLDQMCLGALGLDRG
ncbi:MULTISPECIES: TetR/AcrR family transcriptional regulator [unclassified Rhodococcus (in: high G+C Gram-positive bacteria)]|uniref:TetR/AcrR family transcriptional regulator n=1 Tax=unclassified Rhodococcus (in: high G+C Gram-positive bacteria) TaxID=192944 RepID=UPI00163A1958|nr:MULTISPECIES: TetR/AcrR family transcriptional regulator [unclassified Rhodococcus (in: high G+C Gram-positive bacteria)]MBC2643755.1 TetR/AcrR family transcriptional regulator [Rhodococcus sp. 3A]MBC2891504.1 TetR/AcrR family transcriptional regulator [Rhodococcus sp. 4CII]